MNTNEILSNALKGMSNEEKAKIFPPITRKNFVVRESWMNRNRVLHPDKGWQYINIPVAKATHGTPIHQITVKNCQIACTRICGQLEHYKTRAPYFKQVMDIVRMTFDHPPVSSLHEGGQRCQLPSDLPANDHGSKNLDSPWPVP